jgi:sodium transport system permease protein
MNELRRPRFWRTLSVVFFKESRDARRDRRTMTSVIFGALLAPSILFGVFRIMEEKFENAGEISVVVARGEQMPAFVDGLRARGVTILDPPNDVRAAVADGSIPFALEFDPSFAQQWTARGSGKIELLFGELESTDQLRMHLLKGYLSEMSMELSLGRLAVRGISPAALQPWTIAEERIVGEESRANEFLGMFGMLLLISAFSSTMHMCIDATAGERERHSLEPTLLTGVSPAALIAGKAASAGFYGVAVMAISWTCSMFTWASMQGNLLSVPFSMKAALIGPLAFLFVIPLIICLQFWLYTNARSFREAQVYAGFLMIVPMFSGMFMQFSEIDHDWILALPLLGQQLFVGRCMSGNFSGIEYLAVGAAVSIGLALLFWWATARLLMREKIIYARSE